MNFVLGGVAIVAVYKLVSQQYSYLPSDPPPDNGVPHMTGAAKDHPDGNTVPVKTIRPFKKIADFLFSPFDPTNNQHSISFYDSDNMPRTDFITPGGSRVPTYGHKVHGRTALPGHPPSGLPGQSLGTEKPIKAKTMDKNLNNHQSIWHSHLSGKN